MNFFFHYNKPEADKAKCPKLNVGFWSTLPGEPETNRLEIVDHIDCKVACQTQHRSTHPVCVLSGTATSVEIIEQTMDCPIGPSPRKCVIAVIR